ncbi:very-long-chain 3-ketoacyl-CoA synthase [Coccomyxa subellipsoidea C-169]|uniref:3-ketoacyl-CoA synthase n=1 Tax=Coccomyxa subellipsoidea (strain C-169) TaxID=574566 RepID=I0YLD5_COCSC|nr:very-long-chain 3-ketoacyl-CoA synthase [Coccomyxa subellipsoidea C-169]EIE19204.1 very-long-chain 3-ketoacyl-CoA synthase [Coccomyxa subellipsoidea C-169]|eukprot:XP_005643748.1 very-long-chain 3-ketoacyl-CoA synthase [Coccomyxa subellipsoidea C-169]
MSALGSILADRWGITGQSTLLASAAALAATLVVAEKDTLLNPDFLNSQKERLWELPTYKLYALGAAAVLVFLYAAISLLWPAVPRVLLVDFSCFTPPQRLKCSRKRLMDEIRLKGVFTEANLEFQEKILERSGLGDETGLSDGIAAMKDGEVKTTLKAALEESEMVLYDVVENLLAKSNTDPQEIDIVIVSCSCFAPTPSMAAMITNHFKLRRDVLTYNLSGMGCSSSLICIDLVKHLLKAMPNKLALIVNHENITQNWYVGNDRSMLVCNCLFRLGGAGALLSNRPKDIRRAKYELVHTVRVHLGCEDDAFGCMGNGEDSEGIKGVFLRRNVVSVAGRALKVNLQRLGPLTLPITEMVKVVMNKAYVPKFNNAFEHFLLHTGGRAVIDEMEEKLSLTPAQCQPSKDALYRFGNTSAASTWYILSNIEHFSGLKRGDRIWQLGFGGGFKCNSAVWRARRNVKASHECWE